MDPVRLSRPLPPWVVSALRSVDRSCRAEAVECMLIGAGARVLLLEHIWALPAGRATNDQDFAVQVADWDTYRRLKARLVSEEGLHEGALPHRLLADGGIYIDFLPFGGVALPDQLLHWPDDAESELSVIGFQDAFEDSLKVQVEDDLCVRVVSPSGLLLLKILAWHDRRDRQATDAFDIGLILQDALELVGLDKLYAEHATALEAEDHDPDRAARRVLGERMRAIASGTTRDALVGVLTAQVGQGSDSSLARQLAAQRHKDPQETAGWIAALAADFG